MNILRAAMLKSRIVKWYLTMQVRFKKRKERSDGNCGALLSWRLSYCLKSRGFGSKPKRQQQKDYDIISRVSETGKQLDAWWNYKIDTNYFKVQTFTWIKFHSTSNQTYSKKSNCKRIHNTDQNCFQWPILSVLHPAVHHAQRLSNYFPNTDDLDLTGIECRMQMKNLVNM